MNNPLRAIHKYLNTLGLPDYALRARNISGTPLKAYAGVDIGMIRKAAVLFLHKDHGWKIKEIAVCFGYTNIESVRISINRSKKEMAYGGDNKLTTIYLAIKNNYSTMFDSYCIPSNPDTIANIKHITIAAANQLIESFCKYYGIDPSTLRQSGKGGRVKKTHNGVSLSEIRKCLASYLNQNSTIQQTRIADMLGYRDHTSVIDATQRSANHFHARDEKHLRYWNTMVQFIE